jgi:hypothetical protein
MADATPCTDNVLAHAGVSSVLKIDVGYGVPVFNLYMTPINLGWYEKGGAVAQAPFDGKVRLVTLP